MRNRPTAPNIRSRKWLLWGILALLLAVFGRWVLVENERLIRGLSPGCPLLRETGFYCAGCGGTRAFFALLKGELMRSLQMNPLLVPGLILAFGYGIARLIEIRTGRCRVRISARFGWIVFIGVIAFGIARNIHSWPFNCLAPH